MDSTKLRAAALAKLSDHLDQTQVLTAKDLEHFRKLFASLDSNGDGWISREELRQLFVDEAAVDNALALGDLDGDGGLSLGELLTTSAGQKLARIEQRAWATFAGFDIDGDGIVERSEIFAIADVNAEELAHLVETAIGDAADEIHYDAYLLWFARRELAVA